MISLDRLDAALLRLLSQDARKGVIELTNTLRIARNTAHARLRRMEEGGLLTGYEPRLDIAEAGIVVQAFIGIEIEQNTLGTVVDNLSAIPQVLEAHATTGREDLLVRVACQSQPQLQELIQRLLGIPGVMHTNTTLALTTPLHYRVVPLLEDLTRDAGWGRSTPAPQDR